MDNAKYKYWLSVYTDYLIEDISDELVMEYEITRPDDTVDEYTVEEEHVIQLIEYWIDNYTMGNHKCKEIVDNLCYDIFDIDTNYGTRPESWKQSAWWALDGAIHTDANIKSIFSATNIKLQMLWEK